MLFDNFNSVYKTQFSRSIKSEYFRVITKSANDVKILLIVESRNGFGFQKISSDKLRVNMNVAKSVSFQIGHVCRGVCRFTNCVVCKYVRSKLKESRNRFEIEFNTRHGIY